MNDIPVYPWYIRAIACALWWLLVALDWLFGPWVRARRNKEGER